MSSVTLGVDWRGLHHWCCPAVKDISSQVHTFLLLSLPSATLGIDLILSCCNRYWSIGIFIAIQVLLKKNELPLRYIFPIPSMGAGECRHPCGALVYQCFFLGTRIHVYRVIRNINWLFRRRYIEGKVLVSGGGGGGPKQGGRAPVLVLDTCYIVHYLRN